MKLLISKLLSLCLLASPVWAFHRAGDAVLPQFILTADYSEDGHVDILVANGGVDNVAALIGDGSGAFTLTGLVPTDTVPRFMVTGDINEDGHLDLITPNFWGYDTFVFLGDGIGGFSQIGRLDGGQPVSLILEDLNEDGHLDLIQTNPEGPGHAAPDPIFIFTGNGLGEFSNPPAKVSLPDPPPFFMTSTDLNGDMHKDIVAIASGPEDASMYILLGDGTGNLAHFATNSQGLARAAYVVNGDVNEDGFVDLVVGGGLPENGGTGVYLKIFLGDGTGNVDLTETITINPKGAEDGSISGNIVLDDLNQDTHLDLLIAPSRWGKQTLGNEVFLLLGDGKGVFGSPIPFLVGAEPHSIAVADFNEDGNKDLVVSNRSDGTVSILTGDGTGMFVTIGTYSTIHNDL